MAGVSVPVATIVIFQSKYESCPAKKLKLISGHQSSTFTAVLSMEFNELALTAFVISTMASKPVATLLKRHLSPTKPETSVKTIGFLYTNFV